MKFVSFVLLGYQIFFAKPCWSVLIFLLHSHHKYNMLIEKRLRFRKFPALDPNPKSTNVSIKTKASTAKTPFYFKFVNRLIWNIATIIVRFSSIKCSFLITTQKLPFPSFGDNLSTLQHIISRTEHDILSKKNVNILLV